MRELLNIIKKHIEEKAEAEPSNKRYSALKPQCGGIKHTKRGYVQCDEPIDPELKAFCSAKHYNAFRRVHGVEGTWLYQWFTQCVADIAPQHCRMNNGYTVAFNPYFFLKQVEGKNDKKAVVEFKGKKAVGAFSVLVSLLDNINEHIKIYFTKYQTPFLDYLKAIPLERFGRTPPPPNLIDYLNNLPTIDIDSIYITFIIEPDAVQPLETYTSVESNDEAVRDGPMIFKVIHAIHTKQSAETEQSAEQSVDTVD